LPKGLITRCVPRQNTRSDEQKHPFALPQMAEPNAWPAEFD
jgi:hypothetical protein